MNAKANSTEIFHMIDDDQVHYIHATLLLLAKNLTVGNTACLPLAIKVSVFDFRGLTSM